MKNIITTTIIAFALVVVTSCSKSNSSVPVKSTTNTSGNSSTSSSSNSSTGHNNSGTINSPVTGDWKVISDNNYSFQIGDSASTCRSNYYTGKNGDYFKFTADGNIYIKEGNFLLDTGTFTTNAGNQLTMLYSYSYQEGYLFSGRAGNYQVFTCTTDSLILKNGGITPAGYYIRDIVTLVKSSDTNQ